MVGYNSTKWINMVQGVGTQSRRYKKGENLCVWIASVNLITQIVYQFYLYISLSFHLVSKNIFPKAFMSIFLYLILNMSSGLAYISTLLSTKKAPGCRVPHQP